MLRSNAPELLCLLAALAGACGGADDPAATCAPAGGAVAEVGTGQTEFVSLSPGQDLEIVAGPQGGHHVVLHGRLTGLAPGDPARPGQAGNPSTRFTVHQGDAQVHLTQPPYLLGYADTADGFHTLVSGRIIVVDSTRVAALDGATLVVGIEILDAAGACARDEREVTAFLGGLPGAADAGPGPPDAGAADAGP